MEILKQPQYAPMSVAQMAVSLFAVDRGYLDDIELGQVGPFESAMQEYMSSKYSSLMDSINATPDFTDEVEAKLKQAVDDFKAHGAW